MVLARGLARGIDISSAQTVTSWSAVAQAVEFVIVKATEGTTFTSPTWPKYFKAAGDAGVLRGSYHYWHPRNNVANEARHYIAALKKAGFRSGFDLPPVLDLEETEGKNQKELTAGALAFCRLVDSAFNLTEPWLKTGVYLNPHYYNNNTHGATVVDGRWKWLADWPVRNSAWPSDDSLPRSSAAIWQFTDRMDIPGIKENTDGDVARFTDLHSLAPTFYKVVTQPDPPKPPPPPVVVKPPPPVVKPPTPTEDKPMRRDPFYQATSDATKPQKLANGQWIVVKMSDDAYAMNSSTITPCIFQYDAHLYISGMTPGQQIQVRTFTSKAVGKHAITAPEEQRTGSSPIREFTATPGETFVGWSQVAQELNRGEYLRVEVCVFVDDATVSKAQSKALYWKESA